MEPWRQKCEQVRAGFYAFTSDSPEVAPFLRAYGAKALAALLHPPPDLTPIMFRLFAMRPTGTDFTRCLCCQCFCAELAMCAAQPSVDRRLTCHAQPARWSTIDRANLRTIVAW